MHSSGVEEIAGESMPNEKKLERLSRNAATSGGMSTSYTVRILVESW